tara:strand:+ start:36 stop:491 length:456 start_codon:yes stop_codon:yes gene_type:complete
MALWHFTNLNKYGNPRSRIFHRPDGEAFSFNPNGFGSFIAVRRYKYEYEHPVMPPTILELNGKTYLMPLWKEVVKGTTLDDIEWIKPKPKKKRTEPVIKTFTSGSSDNVYTTKYYPDSGNFHCTCPGSWRSRGNCKHIKELRNKINEQNNK